MQSEHMEYGGYYMEYPTIAQVRRYTRGLPYQERIDVISQGFHFGASIVHCYSISEFVYAVGKREHNNPAGGVRELDENVVVPWLAEVVGDTVLAVAVKRIFRDCGSMAEVVDTVRTVVYVRTNQYREVLEEDGQLT